MAVSLRINSILAYDSLYFNDCKAELYSKNALGVYQLRETLPITNPEYTTVINFSQEVTGKVRICIRLNSGKLVWRSIQLDQPADGSPFRFSVISIDKANTTFGPERFTESINLPMVNDLDDLDEDMVVEQLHVHIHKTHIDVDGRGKIAKG